MQARVAEEAPHLVESDAVPQPRRRGEVPQRVRVQPALGWELSPGAEPVADLDEVPELARG